MGARTERLEHNHGKQSDDEKATTNKLLPFDFMHNHVTLPLLSFPANSSSFNVHPFLFIYHCIYNYHDNTNRSIV